MRIWIFCVSLLCLINSSIASAQTLATVGSKKITVEDFNLRYNEVKQNTINPPEPSVFLEDLVRFEMGVLEAEKQKLNQDPIVQERIRQELYKGLLERAIGKKVEEIKVSEPEMRAFYAKNPELRTQHILIEFKPDANEAEKADARKRANDIYAEVKKSKRPFEELVKLYSDDSLSKNTGGDVGYQSRLTLVPTYYEAAFKLDIGQISDLVPTRYGFHIIKLTGKRAYQQANKKQVRAGVFDDKRRVIFDRYFADLKKNYPVKVDSNVLKTVK